MALTGMAMGSYSQPTASWHTEANPSPSTAASALVAAVYRLKTVQRGTLGSNLSWDSLYNKVWQSSVALDR